MQNKAHVTIILDKSGSMGPVQAKTISGVNEYFQTLTNDKETKYTVDLVVFDTSAKALYKNAPLSKVKPLDNDSYRPDGGTALYDAACDTLMTREGAGQKWIVVIMTDGEENASSRFTINDFTNIVKSLKATGLVQFVYLGANQDAFATAQKWGIGAQNVTNFNATDKGITRAFASVAMNTVSSANLNWNAQGMSNGGKFFNKEQQKDIEGTK